MLAGQAGRQSRQASRLASTGGQVCGRAGGFSTEHFTVEAAGVQASHAQTPNVHGDASVLILAGASPANYC